MVHLVKSDLQNPEVLAWRGIHLLHFMGSSCSQKTRIFLNVKGIEWESHHVDLSKNENYTEWFMGINPRGLVPVLVDDGDVIIESNDILEYLEAKFPSPPLIPEGKETESHDLLAAEDELHLDLRALSMRYAFPGAKPRSDEALEKYESFGTGTVAGTLDPHKETELSFFREMQNNGGITNDQVHTSAHRFKEHYSELDARLAGSPYLLGTDLSLLDIAWYIYSVRLSNAGYPLRELHPRVGSWFDQLNQRPEFYKEVQDPPPMVAARDKMHQQQQADGSSLRVVAGI